jgi:hypothetical protein
MGSGAERSTSAEPLLCETSLGSCDKLRFLEFAKILKIVVAGALADRCDGLVLFDPSKVAFPGRRPPVCHIEIHGSGQPIRCHEPYLSRRLMRKAHRICYRGSVRPFNCCEHFRAIRDFESSHCEDGVNSIQMVA